MTTTTTLAGVDAGFVAKVLAEETLTDGREVEECPRFGTISISG